MDKFSNTTLRDIGNLEYYLTHCVADDSMYNFDHREDHEDKLSQVRDFAETFIEGLDLNKYYEIRDRYREYRNGDSSLHMVLGYRRKQLITLLETFRDEYAMEARKRLFPKIISQMTGEELNEYLQLIGLLK